MKSDHLHILQHSLGVDQYGRGNQYRNRFVTDAGSTDGLLCQELVADGLMRHHGAQPVFGGMNTYSVTDQGVSAMNANSPKPPKLTRGRERYRQFLNEDCGMPFGEWLKLLKFRNRECAHS